MASRPSHVPSQAFLHTSTAAMNLMPGLHGRVRVYTPISTKKPYLLTGTVPSGCTAPEDVRKSGASALAESAEFLPMGVESRVCGGVFVCVLCHPAVFFFLGV